ncbi:hypothetical protein POSPLADRAFT_1141837, partial [Postia placenta MAD-698-R-SB12]
INDLPGDPRERHDSGKEVSISELQVLGVLYRQIPVDSSGSWQGQIDALAEERTYKNRDTIGIESFSSVDAMKAQLEVFFREHMHEDEEIRYTLKGTGFYDIRDYDTDKWIRLEVHAGDLIILPAGIYHRFTIGLENDYSTMRLFKDNPKWIAHSRSAETDSNTYRLAYIQAVEAAKAQL